MSSGDNVATPAPPRIPSPASCSHCGSLFIHTKGCRYCFSSKSHMNTPSKNDKKDRLIPSAGAKHSQCIVPCCMNSTSKTPKKKFFFPVIVGNERKQIWMKAVGVEAMKTKVAICEEHFELEADLENYIKFKYYPTMWNRLKKTAIPTKFSCKSGVTVSGPKHSHIIDLSRKKGFTKKRRSDLSESGIAKKRRKVMASGAILTSKFGHPPELRSPALAQVEVVQDEADNGISRRNKFDFLNGDISTLIAHVQPSICSWDVSVVDVHSPGEFDSSDDSLTRLKSCLTESSGPYVNEGSDKAGGSKTEMKCATPGREQHNRTVAERTTGVELVEQTSSSGSSNEIDVAERQHSELQISNVEQPTKRAAVHNAVCDISVAVGDQIQLPEKVDMVSEQPIFPTIEAKTNAASVIPSVDAQQSASDLLNGEFTGEVENCDLELSNPSVSVQDRSELSENIDQLDKNIEQIDKKTKADGRLSDSQESHLSSSSNQGKCSDDTTVLHVESASDPASVDCKTDLKSVNDAGASSDASEIVDCDPSVPEVSPEKTSEEDVIGDNSSTAETVPSKGMPNSNDIHDDTSVADVTPEPSTTGGIASISPKASPLETPKLVDTSEDTSISEEASSKAVPEPSPVGDTSPASDKVPDEEEPELLCDSSSTSRMEIDPASGGSIVEGGSSIDKSLEEVPLNPSNISNDTPVSWSVKKGRVSKANCSCVMCGGISDVAEDSDIDDSLGILKTSPRTTVTLEQTPHESGAADTPITASSSKRRPGGDKNVLPAQNSSFHIERVLKNIEDQSDFSEYLTDDDPDTTDIDFDSDSEWTPSEGEETPVPIRNTRSSVKAKNIVSTRKTRNSEKAGNASADNSVHNNHETVCEDEGGSSNLLASKRSVRVNLRETVAELSLKNSGTTYSCKQLYESEKSNGETAEPKRSDNVLVVRDSTFEEFNETEPLPQPLVDLLENMKMCFNHFFEKLEKTKKSFSKPAGAAEIDSYETGVKQPIKTLEEDVKMFPALLNLEMVEFVQRCKKYYKKKMEDLGERFKKIRWCANCPEPAVFHCCFKAAYCSCKCQKRDWDEHRKDCAQESVTLLDPHMRLNKSLMRRVKNLSKSNFTISDLETLFHERESNKEDPPENSSVNNENNSDTTPLTPGKRKLVVSPLKTSLKTYPAKQRRRLSSTPRLNGSSDPLKRTSDVDSVELTADPPETVSDKRNNKSVNKCSVQSGIVKTAATAVSKVMVKQKKDDSFAATFKAKPSGMKLTVSPQFRSTISGKTVQLSSRTTSVAASAASKAKLPSRNFLLPKSLVNVGGTNQVMVKLKAVTLPNGEKRLIPINFPEEQTISLLNTSPNGKPVASGPSTILISRPPKSTYSPQTGFVPLSQMSSPLSHSMVIQQVTNGVLASSPVVSVAPQLSPVVPPLPTLTPIPKQGSCCVRTLNDDELDKILNTDHLQSAFDDSYYANTRIRS